MLIITNKELSSVDYYRTMGWWPYFVECDKIWYQDANWNNVPNYDTILVSRPYHVAGWRSCEIVKEFGKRLLIDFDDDILTENPNFVITEDMRKYTIASCRLADLIVCSTKGVEDVYKQFAPTVIRKNVFNDKIFKFEPKFSKNKLVAVRGLRLYNKYNIQEFMPILLENYDWLFYGLDLPFGKNFKEMPFIDYMVSLRTRAPAVLFKPLQDYPSNRAKSNIAWIEATFAGAVCLAPEWDEWNDKGICHYKDVNDAKEKLKWLMNDPDSRRIFFEESLESIKKYMLSNTEFNKEDYGI